MLSRIVQAAQTPEWANVFWFFSSENNTFPCAEPARQRHGGLVFDAAAAQLFYLRESIGG